MAAAATAATATSSDGKEKVNLPVQVNRAFLKPSSGNGLTAQTPLIFDHERPEPLHEYERDISHYLAPGWRYCRPYDQCREALLEARVLTANASKENIGNIWVSFCSALTTKQPNLVYCYQRIELWFSQSGTHSLHAFGVITPSGLINGALAVTVEWHQYRVVAAKSSTPAS
jgi:hypothetical protein